MTKKLFLISVIVLLILFGCQIARKMVSQGLKDEVKESIEDKAKRVINEINETFKDSDNNQISKTLEAIKDLIKLYEENRITIKELSVIKWLLLVLCCLAVIEIGFGIFNRRNPQ